MTCFTSATFIGPTVCEPLAQRAALDERHDKVQAAGRLSAGEQGHDVGVDQPRGKADFLGEAVGADGRRDTEGKELDRHLAAELAVVALEHGAHPPPSQFFRHLEPEGEGVQYFGGDLGVSP